MTDSMRTHALTEVSVADSIALLNLAGVVRQQAAVVNHVINVLRALDLWGHCLKHLRMQRQVVCGMRQCA